MLKNLFSPDSGLMITFAQIADCIFLSLMWVLGCFPVVTAGASTAALYDAVFRGFRQGEKNSWQRFLRTFRSNWKEGLLPTLIFLIVLVLSLRGLILAWNAAVYGQLPWMLFSGIALVGVVWMGVLSILFPLLSRFENTLAGLLRNTLILGLANLPRTLALGLVNTLAGFLCLRFVFPIFFLPALAALIGSLFLEPMFRPFMPKETE